VISTRWIAQRSPYWRRLESLVERAARGRVRSLSPDELQELGLLYRQIAADLATLREDPSAVRYTASVNELLTRAHHTIYAGDRPAAAGVLTFLGATFPAAVRRHARHCLIATLIFLAGGIVGAGLALRDADLMSRVLSPQMIQTIERREMWTHSIVAVKPYAASAIMTNNMSVAFSTFASGLTGGIGTILLLLFNGFLLGVVGAACGQAGMSAQLWSFVAPHGALEVPAILIAGGAGLRLGEGLVFPGFLPRRLALSRAGADAVKLVLGCVPMLIVAGVIEAFVSPTPLAVPMKFAMGAALLALLTWYLGVFGKLRNEAMGQ
jgi:uncharacterized membrane protein SpoIIM required for sporulation